MRTTIAVLVALGALTGCSGGDVPDDPAPPTSAPTSATTGGAPAEAVAAVEAFYDALGQRDCITLRGLSTPEEQREDDAWADCIDTLLEVAGDAFEHRVVSDSADGTTITFTVATTSTIDGRPVEREDPIVLVDTAGRWLVDDSVVTAGA